MKLICTICNKEYEKSTSNYNRAIKLGANLYCSKSCSSEARRKHKPIDQKKAEKAEYDRIYRQKEEVKRKKAEAFKRDYAANPDKYKLIRKRKMPQHVEYCRRPEYRAKKKEYDRSFRAVKNYGPVLGELLVLTLKIADHVRDKQTGRADQANIINGTYNKSQRRKRAWKHLMQNH